MKLTLSFALFAFSSLHTMGVTIIVDDAVISDDFFPPDTQLLSLDQSIGPVSDGFFAISITPEVGNSFRFDFQGIAEEYALFQVSPGLLFTPDYVSTTLPFISNDGFAESGSLTLQMGEIAFLAYWDDRDPFESVPNNNDIFGWVSVTPRSTTGLEVVEGVTAIGAGIVVGTQMTVPEPTVVFLLGGGVVLFLRRKRNL